MKNIKNILQKGRRVFCSFSEIGLVTLVVLLATASATNVFPMRMTEMGKKAARQIQQAERERQLEQERKQQHQPNKYFIYEQGTSNGIVVDKEMFKQKCRSIAALIKSNNPC